MNDRAAFALLMFMFGGLLGWGLTAFFLGANWLLPASFLGGGFLLLVLVEFVTYNHGS